MPEKYSCQFETVRFNKHKHKKKLWMTADILRAIKYRDHLYKTTDEFRRESFLQDKSRDMQHHFEKGHQRSKEDILL